MNDFKVAGRLVNDVEVKERNGQKYAEFLLAVPRGKDNKGTDRGADFVFITAFNRNALKLLKYSGKGHRILAECTVKSSAKTVDGNTEYLTNITARKIEIIDWNEQVKINQC